MDKRLRLLRDSASTSKLAWNESTCPSHQLILLTIGETNLTKHMTQADQYKDHQERGVMDACYNLCLSATLWEANLTRDLTQKSKNNAPKESSPQRIWLNQWFKMSYAII